MRRIPDGFKKSGSVVPIVFGDPRGTIAQFSIPARKRLESIKWFDFDVSNFEKSAVRLMRELRERVID